MYLTLVLLNSISTALYLVLSSKLMKQKGKQPSHVIAAVHLNASLFLAIGAGLYLPELPAWSGLVSFSLLAVVFLKLIAKQMHLYAYSKADVANVTVFSALIPIIGALFGWILLGEVPDSGEVAGTLVICAAIYLMFLDTSTLKTNREEVPQSWVSVLAGPFMHIWRSKPILFGFLSIFPTSIAPVFMKDAATKMPPLLFACVSSFLLGLFALAIDMLNGDDRGGVEWARDLVTFDALILGGIFSMALYTAVASLSLGEVGSTLALQRVNILFQMVFAHFLLGETNYTGRRLALGAVIVAGAFLVQS